MGKTEQFYKNRLQRYFNKHYGEYENDAEFYTNPAPNQWKFYIPELSAIITLTCDDSGEINVKAKIKRIG